jgi:hypothetical protein
MVKLQGFHITRDKTSLLMRNPCSFKGRYKKPGIFVNWFSRYFALNKSRDIEVIYRAAVEVCPAINGWSQSASRLKARFTSVEDASASLRFETGD